MPCELCITPKSVVLAIVIAPSTRRTHLDTTTNIDYFFKNAENKSIGSGRKVVVLCSLAISRIV